MTPTNDALVTVEQCDRDRAWPFRPYLLTDTVATAASWNAGRYDAERVVQAFAAHRLAALASAPAGDGVEALAKAASLAVADAAYHLKKYRPHVLAALEEALATHDAAALARPRAAVGEVPCWSRRMTEEEACELVGFEPDTILTCLREWGYVEDTALQSPPAKVEG